MTERQYPVQTEQTIDLARLWKRFVKNWKFILIISLLFSIVFGAFGALNARKAAQIPVSAEIKDVKASSGSIPKRVLLGFLLGLLVSLVLVIIRFTTDDTYRTETDVNEYAALPVLTCVSFPPKHPKPVQKGISGMWRKL